MSFVAIDLEHNLIYKYRIRAGWEAMRSKRMTVRSHLIDRRIRRRAVRRPKAANCCPLPWGPPRDDAQQFSRFRPSRRPHRGRPARSTSVVPPRIPVERPGEFERCFATAARNAPGEPPTVRRCADFVSFCATQGVNNLCVARRLGVRERIPWSISHGLNPARASPGQPSGQWSVDGDGVNLLCSPGIHAGDSTPPNVCRPPAFVGRSLAEVPQP